VTTKDQLTVLRDIWRYSSKQLQRESDEQRDKQRVIYCDGKAISLRYCADALDAIIEEMPTEDGWQPIAIAPKDGEQIIVAGIDWAALGSHRDGVWWTHAGFIGSRPTRSNGRAEAPIYWMPLPAPPAPASQETDDLARLIAEPQTGAEP